MLGIAPPPQTGSLSTKPAHYSGGYLFVLIYSQPYTQAEGGCGGGGEEGAAEGGGEGGEGCHGLAQLTPVSRKVPAACNTHGAVNSELGGCGNEWSPRLGLPRVVTFCG